MPFWRALWIVGFLLVQVLSDEETLPLNIHKLSLTKFGQAVQNITYLLFQDTASLANQICFQYLLYQDNKLVNCVVGLDHTIRNAKIEKVRQIIQDYYGHVNNAGEIFALTYAYDFVGTELQTVCMFGYPEYSTLALALATSRTKEVTVFAGVPERLVKYVPSVHAYSVASLFNSKLSYVFVNDTMEQARLLSEGKYRCDVLHFVSNASRQEVSLIVDAVSSVNRVRDKSAPAVEVIWSQDFDLDREGVLRPSGGALVDRLAPLQSSDCSHTVAWQLSSTWHSVGGAESFEDKQGFSSRGFSFADQRVPLRRVAVGSLQPSTHCVSPDSRGEDVGERSGLDTVVVITYTIKVFGDTALGLLRALTRLGYRRVLVLDPTLSALHGLTKEFPGSGLLQIAIGPHDMTVLLPRYVVFQMEQLWSTLAFRLDEGEATDRPTRYSVLLAEAEGVLCFSQRHTEAVLALGLNSRVHTVPIYTHNEDSPLAEDQLLSDEDIDNSPHGVDLLFFGSCSGRRMSMVNPLILRVRAHNEDVAVHGGRPIRLGIFCGGWKQTIYDEELSFRVKHAKIVLNIHTEADSVLEVHRINYLLSMGSFVVSERSQDEQLDALYEDSVHFVDIIQDQESLYGLMMEMLEVQEYRTSTRLEAFKLHQHIQQDTGELEMAMHSFVT